MDPITITTKIGNVTRTEYDAMMGPGRPGDASLTITMEPLDPADAKRVVLWGARKNDIQLGGFEDRMQQMRIGGTVEFFFPTVRWDRGQ